MKTALISGGSSGIGLAIARALAQEGMQVIILARNADKLNQAVAGLKQENLVVEGFPADVSNAEMVQKLVDQLVSQYGGIDILVNNAGAGAFGPIEHITEADWDLVQQTIAKGTFLLTRAVVPVMKQAGKGHILAIESDSSKLTFAEGSLYCSSKFAQEGLMQALRKELRPAGIRVSTIYPGFTDTPFHTRKFSDEEKAGWLKPEDVARTALHILTAPEHVLIDEVMMHPRTQEY